MSRVKIAKYAYLISSAAVFLLGVLFLIFPNASLNAVCRVAGAVILISGAVKLYGYFSHDLYRIAFQFDMAFGILTILLGAAMLIMPGKFSEFLSAIISIFVIIDAVFTIHRTVLRRRRSVLDGCCC